MRISLLLFAALTVVLAPAQTNAQRLETACPTREPILTAPVRDSVRDSTRLRTAPATASATGRGPALVLYASATAREVRFATQPRITVRLCGGVMDSVRVLERRNLPDPVQPGVTYRDVFIAVEILGHLNADCLASRIVGDTTRAADPCASLQVRDSATGKRPPR